MQVIMDTGPWVALIDRSESRHHDCVTWLRSYKGEIVSTEAVLTEVLYLLDFSVFAQSAALDFVLTGTVTLVPSSLRSFALVKRLMTKYHDLPMDFADATLVTLAHDLEVQEIVTFDAGHFNIYRFKKKRHFRILP
jgi:predicted nucleic acid-binding protein